MLIRIFLSAFLLSGLATPISAEVSETARETIGWGRFFNNDLLGDGEDRWHTSSYSVSRVRGPKWTGDLPQSAGQIVEFRFRADMIAPGNMNKPLINDRRYVGILSFGLHTHFRNATQQMSLGGDLVFIGPQTGISRFHDFIHDGLGLPDSKVFSNQLPNAVYPTVTGELGHPIALSDNLTFRPFVEGQAGAEYLVRGGADLVLGKLGLDDLLLRDQTTGQRYSAAQGPDGRGLSLTTGADVARVFSSAYLPADGDAEASPLRTRLRAGLNWQGKKSFVFLGVTHLSPEFKQQPKGQTVGSLSLQIKF